MGSVEEILTAYITPDTPAEHVVRGPTCNFSKAYKYVKNCGVYPKFGITFMPPFSYGLPRPPSNCGFKIFINFYEKLLLTDKKAIKERISIQPIDAGMKMGPIFRQWRRNIKTDQIYNVEEDEFGHAVMVVGYGQTRGESYYLIQNSWGENWVLVAMPKSTPIFSENWFIQKGFLC